MKTKMFYAYLLILVAAFWHTSARAEGYDFEIGGKEITSENYTNISAAGGFHAVKKGKVTYDPATRTLTLNNAEIEVDKGHSAIAVLSFGPPKIIKLVGHNIAKGPSGHYGIQMLRDHLRITGNGTLELSGTLGINAGERLVIDGGCTIKANDPIWGDVIIFDNVEVNVQTQQKRPAIYALTSIQLKGGCYIASPQGAVYETGSYSGGVRAHFYKKDGKICTNMHIKRAKNTGIDNPTTLPSTKEDEIYTLDGIRMKLPFERLPKGVYIVNGKKKVKG